MNLKLRAAQEEQMDAADLSPEIYAQVLNDLALVNRVTMASRPTLDFLSGERKAFRLLDVGFGDGDMLRAIWCWAERRSVPCELVGIDLNPHSRAIALAHHPVGASIDYRTGDYAALADEPWDYIVSSLVTHHMSDSQRMDFLHFMEAHARRGWFINDLHRHGFAFYGYPLLARLLRVHRIVREDGQLSIARSFRTSEWHAMLAQAGVADVAQVRRVFPFRLCVTRRR